MTLPTSPLAIFLYLIIINAVGFAAFYIDKRAAIRHQYRVPEKTLLLIALLGGTPGSIVAQHKLRHKTQKQPFKSILYLIAVGQVALLIALIVPSFREPIIDFVKDIFRG